MKQQATRVFLIAALVFSVEKASAVEFEKMGTAISKVLGTTKAVKTSVKVFGKNIDVFHSKQGKADKLAIIEKGLYEPNCTHTWVVGLNAETSAVEQIRVVEMSCPHAFPAQKSSYLEQYNGKGPGDLKTLKDDVHTIAKATGTCNLTTDAVISAITAAGLLKGKI